ncbi:MAG: hypothetical protein AAGI30_00675 [Planctomycetota bacterium]
MASRQSRNNVLAGSLVVVSLVAAVILVAQLGGLREQFGRAAYEVSFPLGLGVEGLGPGSAVSVGGKEAGTVKTVDFRYDDQGNVIGHVAQIAIDRSITLRARAADGEGPNNPVIVRVAGLLATQSNLNFMSTGPIDGAVIPADGSFEASQPQTAVDQFGLRETVDKANAAIDAFRDTVGTFRLDESSPFYEDIRAAIQNVRESTEEVNTWVEQVEFEEDYAQIREVIDRISRSVKNLEDIVAQGDPIVDKVNTRLDDIQEILRVVREDYLAAFRPDIQQSIENFRDSSARLSELTEQVQADYQAIIRVALEDAQQTIAQIERLTVSSDPEVRQMLASLRLGADQLRDTLIEVRRSPWRLLYRPSDQETEYELLYDAARLYAQSVSDLRASVASLESVQSAAAAGTTTLDEDTTQPVVEAVEQAFERYQKAEAIFLERLTGEAPD